MVDWKAHLPLLKEIQDQVPDLWSDLVKIAYCIFKNGQFFYDDHTRVKERVQLEMVGVCIRYNLSSDLVDAWVFPLRRSTVCKNPLYLNNTLDQTQVHLTTRSRGYNLISYHNLSLLKGQVIFQGPYEPISGVEETFALPVDLFVEIALHKYTAAQIILARWWKNLYYRPGGKHYHQTMNRVANQYYHQIVATT
jgi:hypothetical protein